jgi:hypothetical protein
MNNKIKSGVLVGLAMGVLGVTTGTISSIPALRGTGSFLGCCGCVWPILAGMLGALWYIKGSPVRATPSDGAVVGLMVGLVGGLINLIVGLPLQYLIAGMDNIDAQLRQINPNFPLSGLALMLIAGVIGLLIAIGLAVGGGLLGVVIFEKRKDNPDLPPPPQGFGGQPTPGSFGSNT